MKTKGWYSMTVLAILVAGYAIVRYYFVGIGNAGFTQQKLDEATLSKWWDTVLYAHIAGALRHW